MSATALDTAELRAVAERAGRDLEGAAAEDVLRWAAERFGTAWCVASSMADAVLPSLAARVLPGVDVIFLDTGYHFAETIGMRDALAATLPVTVRTVAPAHTVTQQDAALGPRLHDRDPNRCCVLRKVAPLDAALRPYRAWASGRRRDEAATRRDIRLVEWDDRHAMVKLNPIAAWTQDDVDAYVVRHGVLVNPLLSDGYGSVGCAPCTRRIAPGEHVRAGRWAGSAKTECGIHGSAAEPAR